MDNGGQNKKTNTFADQGNTKLQNMYEVFYLISLYFMKQSTLQIDIRMGGVMFFLNKDNLDEFIRRFIISIFLKFHKNIKFQNYSYKDTSKNQIQFKGYDTEEQQSINICLFEKPADNSIVTHIYQMNKKKDENNLKYYRLAKGFMEEYKKFIKNPYEFITENFTEYYNQSKIQFKSQQGSFFEADLQSLFDCLNLEIKEKSNKSKKLYKYKSDPQYNSKRNNLEMEESQERFLHFLDGGITFTNPILFNDPFDCDCNISAQSDFFPKIIFNSIKKTKYDPQSSQKATKGEVDKAVNREAKDLISSYQNKQNHEETVKQLLRDILEEIYKDDNKDGINKKIDKIYDYYAKMMQNFDFDFKENFRILCMAKDPKDISMWGYYGDGGKGVCCEYSSDAIVDAISELSTPVMCIYGDVEYSKDNKKPEYEPKNDLMFDNILNYIVDCIFTKYKSWENEKEFRYVLLPLDGKSWDSMYSTSQNPNYIEVKTKIDDYFFGCSCDKVPYYEATPSIKKKHVLKKDSKMYKLIE
jgi:hypothetical protein